MAKKRKAARRKFSLVTFVIGLAKGILFRLARVVFDPGFVYVLYSPAHPLCCKFGLSINPLERQASIEASLGSRVYKVLALPCVWMRATEWLLLWAWRRAGLSATGIPVSSGYTEWVRNTGFLAGLITWLVCLRLGVEQVERGKNSFFAVCLGVFVPFDACAGLLCLFAAQWAVVFCLTFKMFSAEWPDLSNFFESLLRFVLPGWACW